jgi:hypothetical protein
VLFHARAGARVQRHAGVGNRRVVGNSSAHVGNSGERGGDGAASGNCGATRGDDDVPTMPAGECGGGSVLLGVRRDVVENRE